jgi:hypothetical protein
VNRPEEALGGYDVVFAKARCALEAMATGTAVVLCDTRGLGPLVTLDEVAALRPWNFGMRFLALPLAPPLIMPQIGRYDPDDACAVSAYIREHANFDAALDRYLRLYAEVIAEWREQPFRRGAERRDYLRATVRRLGELERDASATGWMRSERSGIPAAGSHWRGRDTSEVRTRTG